MFMIIFLKVPSDSLGQGAIFLTSLLCFKQAQPKMCHSPKVDDGVEFFFSFLEHIIAIKPKPLELLTEFQH